MPALKELKKLLETFSKNPARIFTLTTLESKETELQALIDRLILHGKDAWNKDECIKIVCDIRKRIHTQKEYLNNNCKDLVLFNSNIINSAMTSNVPPPPFFKDGSDIENFVNSLEFYFLVSKTVEADKKNLLLYLLGESAEKVKNVADLDQKDFTQVKQVVLETLGKKDAQEASVKFFAMKQASDSPNDFALKVKNVAKRAGIKDEKLIVNKVITGLNNQTIKFELLKEDNLTFSNLLKKMSFLFEISKIANEDSSVNYTKWNGAKNKAQNKNKKPDNKHKQKDKKSGENSKSGERKCFFCNKPGHYKKDCFKYLNKLKNKNNSNEVNVNETTSALGSLNFK